MTGDSRIQGQDGKKRKTVINRDEPPGTLGDLWKILGILLFMIGVVIYMVNRSTTSGYLVSMVIGTLAWVCMLSGIGLFNKGRKYTAPGVRAVFAQDKRKPVVYLRSFGDDALTSQVNTPYVWKTEEEQIAQVMNGIGPFIAVGDPREKLPNLGAARVYLGDHEWQRTVSILSSHAQLVVLRAGDTPGLWWEVERVSKAVMPERLLFLIPYDKKQYDAFRRRANQYFSKPLPEYPLPRNDLFNLFSNNNGSSLRGIVYFEKDWTPHFVPLKRAGFRRPDDQTPLSGSLRLAIQPVLEQLRIPYIPLTVPLGKRIARLVLLASLALIVFCLGFFISLKLANP